jgi:hypothetical protein
MKGIIERGSINPTQEENSVALWENRIIALASIIVSSVIGNRSGANQNRCLPLHHFLDDLERKRLGRTLYHRCYSNSQGESNVAPHR